MLQLMHDKSFSLLEKKPIVFQSHVMAEKIKKVLDNSIRMSSIVGTDAQATCQLERWLSLWTSLLSTVGTSQIESLAVNINQVIQIGWVLILINSSSQYQKRTFLFRKEKPW